MIYLFTGNSDYLIREKTLTWKKLFIEKNGDFNLVHIKNVLDINNNSLIENLTATGFMGEKKLLIIDDIPLSGEKKSTDFIEKQEFLESILDKIPESNIVIFSSCNPDKRSRFYKKIKKIATKVEEFNQSGEAQIHSDIHRRFPNQIDNNALSLLIRYKSAHLQKVISEIEKLLITKEKITQEDIKKHVKPELEESIFQLVDALLDKNITKSITDLHIILHDTNIYALYNNLLSNIRTNMYISQMKKLKKSSTQITQVLGLGSRGFLANKSHRISHAELKSLYISLINLDAKMKGGKLLGTSTEDFQFEIENCFLRI